MGIADFSYFVLCVNMLNNCYWKNVDCVHFSSVISDDVSCVFINIACYRP